MELSMTDFGWVSEWGVPQLIGVYLDAAAKVQRFKGHERAEQIRRAAHHAVVLQHHRVEALGRILERCTGPAARCRAPRTWPSRPRRRSGWRVGHQHGCWESCAPGENATSVGGCACSIAPLHRGAFCIYHVWKGSSTEGLCMPIWVARRALHE